MAPSLATQVITLTFQHSVSPKLLPTAPLLSSNLDTHNGKTLPQLAAPTQVPSRPLPDSTTAFGSQAQVLLERTPGRIDQCTSTQTNIDSEPLVKTLLSHQVRQVLTLLSQEKFSR